MAESKQKNVVERLADVGEDALQRIAGAPGGDKVVAAINGMRERIDDLQKRVRGLEALDKRLAAVEKRLDKIEGKGEGGKPAARKSSSTSRKTSG